ncbi:MAG: hypothetical protein AAF349_23695 [Cyanobacteria bacterium P01_A01_bin.68]
MDWFKMYGEFATDPKVQIMPEHMQRRLIMVLCLFSNETLIDLQDEEIAFALRINEEELAETKALFLKKGFIDENWYIANWEKRQQRSDSSNERVKRFRNKQKQIKEEENINVTDVTLHETDVTLHETLHVTECNALDKRREEEIRGDKKKKDTSKEVSKKASKISKPKISLEELSTDHIRDWLAEKRSEGKYRQHDAENILELFKNYCKSTGKEYKDYVAAYKNAFTWERSSPLKQNMPIQTKSAWGLDLSPDFG